MTNVAVVTDRPDHPTLSAYADLLWARGHHVGFVHPESPPRELPATDLLLLKSRTPHALLLGRRAEAVGIPVLNTVDATAACLDRVEMAQRAVRAGLPFPATYALERVADLVVGGRVILKTRHSHRDEPTPVAGTVDELTSNAEGWPDVPLVAQEFADGDGWDHKFWVIGERLFAGLRRPPLTPEGRGTKRTVPVAEAAVPETWRSLVRAVGPVFGLRIYGVDIVATRRGPLIVDVNAFPGFRGLAGAPEALAELTLPETGLPEPSESRGYRVEPWTA
ncbi:alpha-L-glutamate ligase [Streptomycetaceae bacterium NBC_01309]